MLCFEPACCTLGEAFTSKFESPLISQMLRARIWPIAAVHKRPLWVAVACGRALLAATSHGMITSRYSFSRTGGPSVSRKRVFLYRLFAGYMITGSSPYSSA